MKRPVLCVVLCVLLLGPLGSTLPVAAQDDYTLTATDSVAIPPQEVSFEGNTYEITSIGSVEPGSTLTVTSTGPSDDTYALYLYNIDKQILDSKNGLSGEATSSFEMGSEAGTYFVVLNIDGERVHIQPVVVEGYELTLSVPETATTGETVDLTVGVNQRDGVSKQLESIELLLSIDGTDRTVTATNDGNGHYTAAVTIDQSGEVTVSASARGEERIDHEQELLGISHSQSLTVHEPETATETTTDQSGHQTSDSWTEDDQTTTPTAETATLEQESPSDAKTSSGGTATDAAEDRESRTTESKTVAASPTGATTADTTDHANEGVVTPVPTTDVLTEEPTAGTGPVGLPVLLTTLLVLLGSLRLWRRV